MYVILCSPGLDGYHNPPHSEIIHKKPTDRRLFMEIDHYHEREKLRRFLIHSVE